MSVDRAIARSTIWAMVEKFGQQGILLITFLVVARLIGPAKLGLFSLAQIFSIVTSVVILGLVDSIVSRGLTDDEKLSTLFWLVLAISFVMSLGIAILASPIGNLYGSRELYKLIRVISVLPILSGIATVPTMIMQARMQFKVLAIRSILSAIIAGTISILMAIFGYGAFSLVVQLIVQNFVVNLVVWSAAKWRPHLTFNREDISYVIGPGLRMALSYIIENAETQLPRIIIGLSLGTTAVGFYSLAARLWGAFRDLLFAPLQVVFFAPMAELKKDRKEIRRLIGNLLELTLIIWLPALVSVVMFGSKLVSIVFGESWSGADSMIALLFVSVSFRPMLLSLRIFARAELAMGSFVKFQFLSAISAIVIYLIFIKISLYIVFLLILFFDSIFTVLNFYYQAKKSMISFLDILKSFFPPVIFAIFAISIAILTSKIAHIGIEPYNVLISLSIFSVLYFIFVAMYLKHRILKVADLFK